MEHCSFLLATSHSPGKIDVLDLGIYVKFFNYFGKYVDYEHSFDLKCGNLFFKQITIYFF